MNRFENAKRIVIKVGTSTLTYDGGGINIRRFESLVKVISDYSFRMGAEITRGEASVYLKTLAEI